MTEITAILISKRPFNMQKLRKNLLKRRKIARKVFHLSKRENEKKKKQSPAFY